jgi:hypothetical protein
MKYYILTKTFYIIITTFFDWFSHVPLPLPLINYVKNTNIVLVVKKTNTLL